MKRTEPHYGRSSSGSTSSSKRTRPHGEERLPEGMLSFSWVNKNKIPETSKQVDKDSIFNFNQAFQEFQVCFHESLNRTRQQLKKCNIKIFFDYDYKESMPLRTDLNSRYLAHILNIANHEPFVVMKSNINPAKEILAKGRMLLYGICELFNSQIMLFSTSKKAAIIAPLGKLSYDLPRYYVLEHKDSYAITTRYYCLKSYGKHKARTHEVKPYDGIVALKYREGEAKEKLQRHRLGKGIDDIALRLIKEETFELHIRSSFSNSMSWTTRLT